MISTKNILGSLHLLSNRPWETNPDMLRNEGDFINTINIKLNPDLKQINNINTESVRKEMLEFCHNYLKNLLNCLQNAKLINSLDIVNLPLDIDELKNKAPYINSKFNILLRTEEAALAQEIRDLMYQNLVWPRIASCGSSLSLLDLIEGT